LESKSLSA
jgi:hypothetical protein